MTYDEEMAAGFAELAGNAGTSNALTFGLVALVGVLSMDGVDTWRPDTQLGQSRRLLLDISRTELAKLTTLPKVGESFGYGAGKLRILDIDDEEPGSVSITYTVKKSA
jgi:hypothetical protein